MATYKITQKDLDFFEEMARFFVKSFGLRSWELSFDVDATDTSNRAYTYTIPNSKIVMFYLVKEWDYKPKKKELELMAFHEVCELFLSEIMDKLGAFYSGAETERMIHSVIRTLENVFLPSLIVEYSKNKKKKAIKKTDQKKKPVKKKSK